MDIGDWLRGHGLAQYENAFRDNRIDLTILPMLTAEDLRVLGVVAIGDRRRALAAIASLGEIAASTKSSGTRTGAAERRQLTVMFCDLVGSTAISARLDPEDFRGIIADYHRTCTEAIHELEGFVAKYMGDGLLAYFGYPDAHEDDAERAVRAGLAIVERVPKLANTTGEMNHVRVGIATGIVVVGDLIGSGVSSERNVVGDTPNLAARLQAIANPDCVVIAESTRRLVGDLFELDDLGNQELKGLPNPVRVFSVTSQRYFESRFEALHGTLTTLVGREAEMGLILDLWEKAKGGEGQAVLLSGEAGIGKSRLASELVERLAKEPHTRLRYFCSAQHTNSAFYPIITQMERAAEIKRDDSSIAKLDKLEATLAASSTSPENVAILAEMLSISNHGRYPILTLTPQQRRQRTMEALFIQIESLATKNPVLMILEDANWADPSSLEAFGRGLERISYLRVLLVITFRPDFDPEWTGRSNVTRLTLNRLAEREVDILIEQVIRDRPISDYIRKEIIERTDGIPLFVEEMTKAVLEAESESEAQRRVARTSSMSHAVPSSLHASLMTRLDRLGPAKELAQIGAVIGREFSHALLAAVAAKSPLGLDFALEKLISAGLLFRDGLPPQATYRFKHALVQDAAYGTLLRGMRRALHVRTVEALETWFVEIVERQPEVLARHCVEAGLIQKAAEYWGTAGQQSLLRSALLEAIEQLTRGVTQIAALPSTPDLRRKEIVLRVALITPLLHVKGYAAPETKAAVDSAGALLSNIEALGESLDDPLLLFVVLYGFWVTRYVAFDGEAITVLAAQFMTLAESQPNKAPIIVAHRLVGTSLMSTGRFVESEKHFDQAISLFEPAEHRKLASRFGQDLKVVNLSYRSWALWFLGNPDSALKDADEAVSDAREIGQAATLMQALAFASWPQIYCGNYAKAKAQADEVVALADQTGAFLWSTVGKLIHAWILTLTGDCSKAVRIFTPAVAALRSTGTSLLLPAWLSYLGKAHAELGQFDEAWQCLGEAKSTIGKTGETWYQAELHRVAGEIALLCPNKGLTEARAHFQEALAVARCQQAKSWELRIATSVARLWLGQEKRKEAGELLAPVYQSFKGGFDTLDLRAAKALLDQLS